MKNIHGSYDANVSESESDIHRGIYGNIWMKNIPGSYDAKCKWKWKCMWNTFNIDIVITL